MTLPSRVRLTAAALGWAAALVLAAVTPAQAAPAAEGKSLVVLGDSFTANGDIAAALENAAPGAKSDCSHSPTSWPTQLAQATGVWGTADFADLSCRGASLVSGPGLTLVHQARNADAQGAFGPRTRAVFIQSGLNDAWGENTVKLRQTLLNCVLDLVRGCGPEAAEQGRATDFRGVNGALFADKIRPVVQYVRYYAPNARIVLVGYPEMNAPGQQHWCVDVLGLGSIVQQRAGAAIALWDRMDAAQREAAALLGVEFFDARAVTAGHGLCSPEPWLAGILDPRSELMGTPLHPSARGDAAVAAGLRELIPS
ncbi:GDSL-like Lipase/Acylhydrolase family protein [Nocardia farcinica]|uniref:Esterase n=3 Tax=Nocardia farcinica TaxID=37329 RepID=A0A0H5NRD7_NOCFR|nr:SGNH/GDSL hydrolase family protein [Nocardia farcinica]AXK85881.1 SGNH/GDSL hydrolase family protein [Nocardia farcinica]CRY77938.1 Esterase precursor [Nocardia farcinica]SIS87506.1 GDSL-like Lipase/Acylhydrolase family protein [Nocardia farcinica]